MFCEYWVSEACNDCVVCVFYNTLSLLCELHPKFMATKSLPGVASALHFTPSSVSCFLFSVFCCSIKNKVHVTPSRTVIFLCQWCRIQKDYGYDGARGVMVATTLFCPFTKYKNLWQWMRKYNCFTFHDISLYCRGPCLKDIMHIVYILS